MSTISDFNSLSVDLITQLSMLCPRSIIAINSDIIIKMIKNDPNKLIDIFTLHILKYKPQIDSGDDNFFINNSFSSEVENNTDMINKIFEFKSIWKQLNQQNRDFVKQYMQYLCQLALAYIS